MESTIVITGAGSGVGRATARLFSQRGWQVALVGRRSVALEETRAACAHPEKTFSFSCDISDAPSVSRMAESVRKQLGAVGVLVNGAGTNTPARSLKELSFEKYREIVETNLTGAYLCTQAFLPEMRARKSGTIVNIVSDAAKQASAKAGPGYVVSKFGMLGLTQSINAEERAHGIRACALMPGDIDTPLLEKRPQVPNAEARTRMLQPEDVAECVWLAVSLPPRAIVEELLLRPA